MAENIKLNKTTQTNFTVSQGYFYSLDYSLDNLLQKTDDGNTAFSYPVDVLLTQAVNSLEYDGVYFWSLENPAGSISIKRWKIDNYVCKLQQTITLTDGVSNNYDADAFSIEHYHTQLSSPVSSGASTIYMDDYWDDSDLMNYTSASGNNLVLHIGPNSNGEEEDVYVTGTVSGGVTISGATLNYGYADDDPVNFYTRLWVFNNYNGIDSSTGALYKLDAYTGDQLDKYPGGAYKDITAATFYNVDSFSEYGSVDTLIYIKGTNMLFVNVDSTASSLPYYGSMVMENIEDDEITVIPIYDVAIESEYNDNNVYKLQEIEDGAGSTWSTYNYELASLDPFVTSISLSAYPATIAANGTSSSTIRAVVRDQFLQPISGRLVYFSDNDPDGSITGGSPKSTDSDGLAETVYTAGTSAGEVTITALVEQT